MRTDEDAVKGILLADYDSINEPDLTPFIDTASLVVDRVEVEASVAEVDLTDVELEMIERWLSAHMYVMSDQNFKSKSNTGTSGAFQGSTALYLEASKYGMTAMILDYSGSLASINSTPVLASAKAKSGQGRTVGGVWLGSS